MLRFLAVIELANTVTSVPALFIPPERERPREATPFVRPRTPDTDVSLIRAAGLSETIDFEVETSLLRRPSTPVVGAVESTEEVTLRDRPRSLGLLSAEAALSPLNGRATTRLLVEARSSFPSIPSFASESEYVVGVGRAIRYGTGD